MENNTNKHKNQRPRHTMKGANGRFRSRTSMQKVQAARELREQRRIEVSFFLNQY